MLQILKTSQLQSCNLRSFYSPSHPLQGNKVFVLPQSFFLQSSLKHGNVV